jgi:hypothetical protein
MFQMIVLKSSWPVAFLILSRIVPPQGVARFTNDHGGLACTSEGSNGAGMALGMLPLDPWFSTVLASGNPLCGPLAEVFVPVTGSCTGKLQGIFVPAGPLWA